MSEAKILEELIDETNAQKTKKLRMGWVFAFVAIILCILCSSVGFDLAEEVAGGEEFYGGDPATDF